MSYASVSIVDYTSIDLNMSSGIPAIFEFPGVAITSSKLEIGVIKMVRRVRPDWRKEDIILQTFLNSERASQNVSLGKECKDVLYGGYTSDKGETVMIKIFQPFTEDPTLDKSSMMHPRVRMYKY